MSELIDWFHRICIRDPVEEGYKRIDLKYAPFFKMQVTLNELISPAHPLSFLQWEMLERVRSNFAKYIKPHYHEYKIIVKSNDKGTCTVMNQITLICHHAGVYV